VWATFGCVLVIAFSTRSRAPLRPRCVDLGELLQRFPTLHSQVSICTLRHAAKFAKGHPCRTHSRDGTRARQSPAAVSEHHAVARRSCRLRRSLTVDETHRRGHGREARHFGDCCGQMRSVGLPLCGDPRSAPRRHTCGNNSRSRTRRSRGVPRRATCMRKPAPLTSQYPRHGLVAPRCRT